MPGACVGLGANKIETGAGVLALTFVPVDVVTVVVVGARRREGGSGMSTDVVMTVGVAEESETTDIVSNVSETNELVGENLTTGVLLLVVVVVGASLLLPPHSLILHLGHLTRNFGNMTRILPHRLSVLFHK